MWHAHFPLHQKEYVLVTTPSEKRNQKDDEVPDNFDFDVASAMGQDHLVDEDGRFLDKGMRLASRKTQQPQF